MSADVIVWPYLIGGPGHGTNVGEAPTGGAVICDDESGDAIVYHEVKVAASDSLAVRAYIHGVVQPIHVLGHVVATAYEAGGLEGLALPDGFAPDTHHLDGTKRGL